MVMNKCPYIDKAEPFCVLYTKMSCEFKYRVNTSFPINSAFFFLKKQNKKKRMYKVKARERWLLSNSVHSAWTPFCNGQGLPNLTIPNAIYCNIPQCSGPPVPLSLLWHTIDWDLFLLSSKFHIKSFTSWLYCLNNDVGMIFEDAIILITFILHQRQRWSRLRLAKWALVFWSTGELFICTMSWRPDDRLILAYYFPDGIYFSASDIKTGVLRRSSVL